MSTLLLPIIYKAGSCTGQSFVVRTGPSDAIEPPVYVRGVSVNEQKYGIAREQPSHQYLSAMVFSEYRLKDHPLVVAVDDDGKRLMVLVFSQQAISTNREELEEKFPDAPDDLKEPWFACPETFRAIMF